MNKLTQQQQILKLLKETPAGVNSYDLTFEYHIKQAPTRIRELKDQGYLITASRNGNQSVTYHLQGEVNLQASKATTEPQMSHKYLSCGCFEEYEGMECHNKDHYEPYVGKDGKTYRRPRVLKEFQQERMSL